MKSEAKYHINSSNKTYILGVGVNGTELVEVLTKIATWVKKSPQMKLVTTVNPEFIVLAQDDPEFKNILNNADLNIPDGNGLKLAGIKNIIPGRKLVQELIKKSYKIFYLGSRVAGEMAKKYGGAYDDGELDIKYPRRNSEIVAKINKYQPDILLVAYGAPAQEKWLSANRNLLKAKVGIGVGGAFDYLTGKTKLPPKFIERYSLEWLWRLVQEPWRWRRQLRLIRFMWLYLTNCDNI